jgi:ketosteroid isomerase-like protein
VSAFFQLQRRNLAATGHLAAVAKAAGYADLYADGDAVIIFFDASAIARDGQPYVNSYAWFWQMRNGRVVSAHAIFDSIAFNELLRRVPAG